jgi:death-on-curing protein
MAARCGGSLIAKRHYRLTLADALSAHERALTLGGLPGILHLSRVESAVTRPYTGYYRRIWEKAAALVQSVAADHGFVDGNKRTALLLLYTLIENSGYKLAASDDEAEEIILTAASSKTRIEDLRDWFRPRIVRA